MALQLTTNGDAVANAAGGSALVTSRSPMSISAWINALWDGQTKTSSYVGLYNSVGQDAAIQIGSRTAQGQCDIWSWGGALIISSSGITIPQNTWINITFTYDGTTARLYINGVFNASAAYTATLADLNQVFINGYPTGATVETATFQADTYDLYNRVLTADEITTICNTRGSRHGIVFGSLFRYEFDEGVVGQEISEVFNQCPQFGTVSNSLVSNSSRTPRVTFVPAYASHNLRLPT